MERIDRLGDRHLGGTTLTATGLGAYIAKATESGDFRQILTGVAVMSVYVVALNRLFWRRLYRLAETRRAMTDPRTEAGMTPTAVNATDTVGRPGSAASPNLVEARDVRKTFATRDGSCPCSRASICGCGRARSSPCSDARARASRRSCASIAGLIPPTDGAVLYRGQPFVGANPGVGMVFQSFALLPWLTVQQNVELGLEARGMLPAERARRALARSTSSAWTASNPPTPRSSPAACVSAWASPARWSSNRTSC